MTGHDDLWDNDLDGPRPWILDPGIEDRRPLRTNPRIQIDHSPGEEPREGWDWWQSIVIVFAVSQILNLLRHL